MILKYSMLLVMCWCCVSGQTSNAAPFKSILDYVAKSNKFRTVVSPDVTDSMSIQFNIVDTVNSVSDHSYTMMILYPFYISHKYNASIKEWDSDSSIQSSVDSLAQYIKPYDSEDLRNLSSPTSPVKCNFIEYEPMYVGVSVEGPLNESINQHYRLMAPVFSLFMLFHVDSSDVVKLIGEHVEYSGIGR